MKGPIFRKKYDNPKGKLYPKLSFRERYNTVIVLTNWACAVALTFLIGFAVGGW